MSRSFRVFLVFGIAVSCLTSLGNASVAEPYLNWDAAWDTAGDDEWESILNDDANRRWNFGSDRTAHNVSGSNFGAIDWAYDETATMDSWQEIVAGSTTKSATFELVIRPNSLTGDYTLFETGGNGDGTALTLKDNTLKLRVQNYGATGDPFAEVTTTLAAAGLFYDILFTIDVDTDLIELFVDGSSRGFSDFGGVNDFKDWAGGDNSGLQRKNGGRAGGGNDGGAAAGDLAIMRYYHDDVLDQSEIDGNFAAMQAIPEPSSIALWSALGIIGLAVARRKRKLTHAA